MYVDNKCLIALFSRVEVCVHNTNLTTSRFIKEKSEDTKEVIRTSKLKKERKYNGQQKRDKRTKTDLENKTQKT